MKRFQCFMVVALVASIFCLDASAESPFDGIGRGRLLRKWRDDLVGKPPQQQRSKTPARNTGKQPTPAQRPTAQPTPARRPTTQPTPAQRSNAPNAPQASSRQNWPAPASRTPYDANRTPASASAQSNRQPAPRPVAPNNPMPVAQQRQPAGVPQQAPTPAETAAPRTSSVMAEGFGMEVQADKDDKYYVVRIDPRGNAAKAGVSRGDILLQVGGTDVGSIEELNEICKILSDGDQLEFQISHRGQDKKIFIPFGEAKPLPVAGEEEVSNQTEADETDEVNHAPVTGRYDFVPQASNRKQHSILVRPESEKKQIQPASFSHALPRTNQQRDSLRRQPYAGVQTSFGDSVRKGS